MWRVEDTSDIGSWIGEESLLIADGHHRYTTALSYRDEMRAAQGSGPWDRVLTLIVDAGVEEPPVLPFHRIMSAPASATEGAVVRDLQEVLSELNDDTLTYGTVAREDGRLIHRVAELAGAPPTVVALHEQIIDADAVARGDVRFTQDAVAAEEAVHAGDAAVAYFLPATTTERIRAVVQRGERLPQKSTFFWPKPRTGMIIRSLELDVIPPAVDPAS